LIAWIFAGIGVPPIVQLLIFLGSSGILLYFTRPIAQKFLKIGHTRTNSDRLIGEVGIVIEKIDTIQGTGQIKVSGQIWSAKSFDKGVIERDDRVEILDIQGVKLVVKKIN